MQNEFNRISKVFYSCFGIEIGISSLKKEKNGMKKNANHSISMYGNCMIRIFFIILIFWKKSFEQSIQLLPKHLNVFWAATTENFDFFFIFVFWKNTSHTNSIYGNCMTSIFLMATTKYCDDKIFLCFFQPQNDFRIQKNIFLKKNCMQNLIFCVYNVVLDILILDLFPFLFITFLKKRLKFLFLLVWHVFVCLD